MQRIRWIFLVVNAKTGIITLLAVASTWACRRWDLVADFPMTLVALAVVFPIVFSIGTAYKRREAVLREYAVLKGHGLALYYAARDWMEGSPEEARAAMRVGLEEVLASCRGLLAASPRRLREQEPLVYQSFSGLSQRINGEFRGRGLAGGEISRANQYLSKMLVAFENIKHIYQYRTPVTLRAFSDLFITILPPLYGPYFAHISQGYAPALAYVTPILFSMVLVGLDNIQAHLENPFDQVGEDDVTISVEPFLARLDPSAADSY